MKIGIRGGHSPKCKGAIGIRDEQSCVRDWSYKVKEVLEKYGHTVIDCNSNSNSVSGELNEGTNKANNNNVDVYITLHMNAYNRSARGVEAYCYNRSSKIAVEIAERAVNNIAELGTPNRGVKYNTGLHDLRASAMQSVIIETFFCDNKQDMDIYTAASWDTLAYRIANAIDPNIPKVKPQDKPLEQTGDTYFRVVCGSYKERINAENRKKALEDAGFTGVFLDAFKK